jgi:hypothetical protein
MELDKSMIVLLLIQQGASPWEIEKVMETLTEIPITAPVGAYVFQLLMQVRTEAYQKEAKEKADVAND